MRGFLGGVLAGIGVAVLGLGALAVLGPAVPPPVVTDAAPEPVAPSEPDAPEVAASVQDADLAEDMPVELPTEETPEAPASPDPAADRPDAVTGTAAPSAPSDAGAPQIASDPDQVPGNDQPLPPAEAERDMASAPAESGDRPDAVTATETPTAPKADRTAPPEVDTAGDDAPDEQIATLERTPDADAIDTLGRGPAAEVPEVGQDAPVAPAPDRADQPAPGLSAGSGEPAPDLPGTAPLPGEPVVEAAPGAPDTTVAVPATQQDAPSQPESATAPRAPALDLAEVAPGPEIVPDVARVSAPTAESAPEVATAPADPRSPAPETTLRIEPRPSPLDPPAETAEAETAEVEKTEPAPPVTTTEAEEAPRAPGDRIRINRPGTDDDTLALAGEPEALTPSIGERVVPLTERAGTTEPAQPADTAATENLPPLERYAAPFQNQEGKPLMAIVLIDDGRSLGVEALQDFPYPLTFAVDPEAEDAAEKMARHRDAGFEVVALVDLPEAATPSDAEVVLSATFDRLPEALAVIEGTGTGIQGNRELSDQVAAFAGSTGRGLIAQGSGFNTVEKLALRDGVPATSVFRDFDSAGQTPVVMRRFLDQAAFKAGVEGSVVMLGRVRPDTISALLLWGLQDRASRVALAPISAVLRDRLETQE